jgi:hypothetical protein
MARQPLVPGHLRSMSVTSSRHALITYDTIFHNETHQRKRATLGRRGGLPDSSMLPSLLRALQNSTAIIRRERSFVRSYLSIRIFCKAYNYPCIIKSFFWNSDKTIATTWYVFPICNMGYRWLYRSVRNGTLDVYGSSHNGDISNGRGSVTVSHPEKRWCHRRFFAVRQCFRR